MSAGFLVACGAHVAASMTPNTSWEHHPFLGPLVVLHTARQPLDHAVGGVTLAALGTGLCLPAFRANAATVVVAVLSAVAWVGISILAAASASV